MHIDNIDKPTIIQECLTCITRHCKTCYARKKFEEGEGMFIEHQEDLGKPLKIKSDGGSSSYYTFHRDDGSLMETEEVIRCLVDNDFDLGNIIKASRRISEDNAGRGKKGSPALYDWKKILYTAEKRIAILEVDDD